MKNSEVSHKQLKDQEKPVVRSKEEKIETQGLEFDELKPCGDYFQTAKSSSTGSSW
ncbi:MAG: hypothetical protein WBC91_17805 [Phototrophicaceae bacterium]